MDLRGTMIMKNHLVDMMQEEHIALGKNPVRHNQELQFLLVQFLQIAHQLRFIQDLVYFLILFFLPIQL